VQLVSQQFSYDWSVLESLLGSVELNHPELLSLRQSKSVQVRSQQASAGEAPCALSALATTAVQPCGQVYMEQVDWQHSTASAKSLANARSAIFPVEQVVALHLGEQHVSLELLTPVGKVIDKLAAAAALMPKPAGH